MKGLLEAMAFFGHKQGTIVTLNQNDRLVYGDKEIQLCAAHLWLPALENAS